jgi:hypothetical protein
MGGCGIFLALFNIFSTVRLSSQFNIVQTVRMLRKGYPELVNKFEQYRYLYEMCCSNEALNLTIR